MLVYTQRSFLRYDLVARGINLIFELMGKSNQAMLFLFSPEDSSKTDGTKKRMQMMCSSIHIPGLMKALFWIAFSIAIASLVGRLN